MPTPHLNTASLGHKREEVERRGSATSARQELPAHDVLSRASKGRGCINETGQHRPMERARRWLMFDGIISPHVDTPYTWKVVRSNAFTARNRFGVGFEWTVPPLRKPLDYSEDKRLPQSAGVDRGVRFVFRLCGGCDLCLKAERRSTTRLPTL
jgi:hypothetical protein